jgi:hypothetical protein
LPETGKICADTRVAVVKQLNATDDIELSSLLEQGWRAIERSTTQPGSAYLTPVIGMSASPATELRTVVLRHASWESRQLVFHTDARSQKVEQLQLNSQVSWLFFDHESGIQIRAQSVATIHHDNEYTRKAWARVPKSSRQNYAHPQAPGTLTDWATCSWLDDVQSESNFMVIECEVFDLDWLKISTEGNLRAQFTWDGQCWNGQRVTP